MKNKGSLLKNLIPSLQNKEEFFEGIFEEATPMKKILLSYLLLCIFSFVYGVVMGAYHSFFQALTTGVKLTFLFSAVLLICFPAFFIVQFLLGSKLTLGQMISMVLSGFVLCTAIMISFAPISLFFLITGSNYYFLQLLHIIIFLISGFFAMNIVVEGLKYSCEKKNIYPKTGVIIFRFWIVIFAFVFIQLAWNLRPFLGDRGQPFQLFRKYEGNFYSAVIYSVQQLMGKPESEQSIIDDQGNSSQPRIDQNQYRLQPLHQGDSLGN